MIRCRFCNGIGVERGNFLCPTCLKKKMKEYSDEQIGIAGEDLSPGDLLVHASSNPLAQKARDLGELLVKKDAAYGSATAKSEAFLKLLYPDGIKPEQYGDALGLARVFDKQCRIATNNDPFGEDPWMDIGGYGIVNAVRKEKEKK